MTRREFDPVKAGLVTSYNRPDGNATVRLDGHTFVGSAMAHLIFRTVLAAMLSVPFAAISFNEAPAQQRASCSQARSLCGKQPVCQRRYEACMETGCWTVELVKRCGYEKE